LQIKDSTSSYRYAAMDFEICKLINMPPVT